MFLNQGLVKVCYQRLAPKLSVGKSHLERTSCLMYFLASDAVCARLGRDALDLNPGTDGGKACRRLMDSEFSRLVLISLCSGVYKQVEWLGEIASSNRSPSMKIASNFYSVPLKNAAASAVEYPYPRRPNNPILEMGKISTGLEWGLKKHRDWEKNLPVMFEHSSSSTPFTDLAVFILRDTDFEHYGVDYFVAFKEAMSKRFSVKLVEYWAKKIYSERVFGVHMSNVFSDMKQNSQIQDRSASSSAGEDYAFLYDHIKYLEDLLRSNGVSFNALGQDRRKV